MKRFLISLFFIISMVMGSFAQQSPSPRPKSQYLHITNMEYKKGSDLRDVLTNLGRNLGVNIFLDPSIMGTTSFHITDVSFETGLAQILEPHNFTFLKLDNIYYIVPRTPKVKWENNRITIEAKNTPLNTLFQTIVKETNLNLIWNPTWYDRTNIYIYDMDPDQAMAIIARQSGLTVEKSGSVYEFKRNLYPPSDNFRVVYDENGLSIEARDANIYELVREITRKTGFNVQAEMGLNQTVSGSIQKMKLREGLTVFFGSINRLSVSYSPTVFFIGAPTSNNLIVSVVDGKLSVKSSQGQIVELLRHIKNQTNIPITYENDVSGSFTAEFNDMDLLEGLSMIMDNQGFTVDRRGQGFHIRRKQNNNISIRMKSNHRFDILVSNETSLSETLKEMAKKVSANIIIYNNVETNVKHVQVFDVTFEEACNYLMQGTPFRMVKSGEIYKVANITTPTYEASDVVNSETFIFTHLNVEMFFNSMLPSFFNRSMMMVNRELNAITIFGTMEQIEAFRKYKAQLDKPDKGIRSEIIRLKYMKAEEAAKVIPNELRNNMMVIPDLNAISYTGTNGNIDMLRTFLESIDQPTPIISCDILVLQVSHEQGATFGLQNMTYQDGLYLGTVRLDSNDSSSGITGTFDNNLLRVKINALLNSGKAKVITNTNISSMNNVETSLKATTKYSINIARDVPSATPGVSTTQTELQTIETGLTITFTPWVSDHDYITLKIVPSIIEFLGAPLGTNVYTPTTNTRELHTTVRVKNKETIIIGGLIQQNQQHRKNKIPLLGDIPIIGSIFSFTSVQNMENEFVIIITPHLLREGETAEGLQSELNKTFRDSVKDSMPIPSQTPLVSPTPGLQSASIVTPGLTPLSSPAPTMTPTPTPKNGNKKAAGASPLRSSGPAATTVSGSLPTPPPGSKAGRR